MIEEENKEEVKMQEPETPAPETEESEADETREAEKPETPEAEQKEEAAEVREPKFVNKTGASIETLVEVGKIVSKGFTRLLLILGTIMLSLGVVMMLVDTVLYGESVDGFWIVLIILGLFMLVFSLFYKKLLRKGLTQKLDGRQEITRFMFFIDGFEFEGYNKMAAATSRRWMKGNFAAFTEIREYKNYWMIFYGKAEFDVMEKNGMVEGDAAELSRFLAVRLGAKYKVCNK